MVSCYFCQSPVLVALFIDLKVFLVYFITRNSETVLEVFLLSVERLISSTALDDLNTSFVVFWVLRKERTVLFFLQKSAAQTYWDHMYLLPSRGDPVNQSKPFDLL